MPIPSTAEEFLALVGKSGLVEQGRLESYLQQLRDKTALPGDARALASLMIRDGLLTYFQTAQLLAGKSRGYTISKYKVLERLGTGGMGTVYLCEHQVMRRRVAIKVLPANRAKDPSYLARFQREARAAAALDHPNIVRAHDIGQEGTLHFLVMEYIDGASLHEIVHKYGPMDYLRAAHYIRQAAQGLQHAHEAAGLVHRDIKPSNLLVDHNGTVKILDMGLARFTDDQAAPLTDEYDKNSVMGTADYFAPEQALSSHDVDIRADLYSLGATFYFLLTGSPPFEGTTAQKIVSHQMRSPRPIQEVRPEVPSELAAVINRMLAKDAAERYQTPAEVTEVLTAWTQMPAPPPPEVGTRRLSPAALSAGSPAGTSPSKLATTKTNPAAPRPAATRPLSGLGPSPDRPSEQVETPLPAPAATQAAPTQPASPRRSARRSPVLAPADNGDERFKHAITIDADDPERVEVSSPSLQTMATYQDWTSGTPSASSQRRRRIWWAAGVLGALFVTAVGATLLTKSLWASRSSPTTDPDKSPAQDKKPDPANLDRLIVARSGQENTFRTLGEALRRARPGARIQVRDEVIEEVIRLSGVDSVGKNVTIEADLPGGRPVTWHAPTDLQDGRPLLDVTNVPGLRLKGFRLDGLDRANDLVLLSGRCPDLTLEDVHLLGFRRSAVLLNRCAGEDIHPLSLVRVRAATRGSETALLFEGEPGQPNRHVQVLDSRFEGPFWKAVVQLAGPVEDVIFRRNRFYNNKSADAFLIKRTNPPSRIQLAAVSNTFVDLEKGFHWETMPAANQPNRIVALNNLFIRTKKLGFVDGLATEPKNTSAQWIWFDEAKPPPESRYFRKTFEVSKSPTGPAILDVCCDDAFTVWLNGVQVARSPLSTYTKHVYAFDVKEHLRPGQNVLAVLGTNAADFVTGNQNDAGLLVQLTYTPAGEKTPTVIVSDKSWKASKTGPQDWQQPDFNDSGWAEVKVQGPYGDAKAVSRFNLLWDSVIPQQLRGAAAPILLSSHGNVRDGGCTEGFPPLDARYGGATVATDPNREVQFLRYAETSPLCRAGTENSPVGVPPLAAVPAAEAAAILQTRSGPKYEFSTVREALLRAKLGDHVLVRREILEEPLVLTEKDGIAAGVILEANTPSGKPVVWRVPAGHPSSDPLLQLTNVTGLYVKGFILDGQDRVGDLVVLSGRCPGLIFEDIHLRGFKRSAVKMSQCTAEAKQPLALRRLRTTTTLESEAALSLEAPSGQVNQYLHVRDCRFEGFYKTAVLLNGPAADVEFQHNRFFQAGDGFLYKKTTPRAQVRLALLANTFCDVQRIMHFEAAPAADKNNHIVMRNNLFARPARLVDVDDFAPELKTTPASWIWCNDDGDPLKQAPRGDRLFRRTFDLPNPPASAAVLNITCDDVFTVWLNGEQVGNGHFHHYHRRVYAFDVQKHLRPGKNVLAVKGTNEMGQAGLLVHLAYTSDAGERTLVSDDKWLASKVGPQGWNQLAFNDSGWQPALMLTPYSKPQGFWRRFIWDSVVQKQYPGIHWPLFSNSTGNISCKRAGIAASYTLLEAQSTTAEPPLSTDPTDAAQFLRYPKSDPLFQAGPGKTPVGVPPVE